MAKVTTKAIAVRLAALVVGIALSAGIAEWGLREAGIVASWAENNGQNHLSPFRTDFGSSFALRSGQPGTRFSFRQSEFDFEVNLNRHGVRDVDHPLPPADDEVRIAFLGDSFTMGQGAEFADSFPQQLGRLLAQSSPHSIRVVQAGVAGSDPVFALELLERSILAEEPRWVVLTLNSSDVEDVIVRGGRDRFADDGQLRGGRAPWWEPAFNASHLVRTIAMKGLGFNWYLMREAEMRRAQDVAVEEIRRTVLAMADLGVERGYRLVVVVHPFAYDVSRRDAAPASEFAPIYPSLQDANVVVIDLFEFFRESIEPDAIHEYFWPLDQHCTAAGYRLFAEGVYGALLQVEGFPDSI